MAVPAVVHQPGQSPETEETENTLTVKRVTQHDSR
jgi:hypothetical protein